MKAELLIEERNGTVVEVIRTGCCGARHWKSTAPSICLLCGEPITEVCQTPERKYDHLLTPTTLTRYWS